MLKLNRKIEYALMVLQYLNISVNSDDNAGVNSGINGAEGSVSKNFTAKEVAEEIGAPFEVAARVMQTLAQHQWLKVEHGSKGGYQLQKELSSITMKDLIEVLDGPLALVKCTGLKSEPVCEILQQCNIVTPMQNLNHQLNQFYSRISLEDLLGAKNV